MTTVAEDPDDIHCCQKLSKQNLFHFRLREEFNKKRKNFEIFVLGDCRSKLFFVCLTLHYEVEKKTDFQSFYRRVSGCK